MSGFKKRRSGFVNGFGGGLVAASGKTAERDLRPMMGMRGMLRGGGRMLPSPTMERRVSGSTLDEFSEISVSDNDGCQEEIRFIIPKHPDE